jgi:hypothetical protein
MPLTKQDLAGEFEAGDSVRVTMLGGPLVGRSHVLKIMLVTDLREAERLQVRSKELFVMAGALFGEEIQVLWIAEDDPTGRNPTFYEMNEQRTIVNGFPVLLTNDGTVGLDGVRLQVEHV